MTQAGFRIALAAAREKGRAAMQALAEDHLPLVGAMVRRFPPGLYEPEELYQQGCLGLMKALIRFRPEMEASFTTYAVPLILGEMRQLSRQSAPIHIPRTDQEARQRIRRTANALTLSLHREPTIREIAAALRMDAADVALLAEEVCVTSSDAAAAEGSPLGDSLADTDDWLTRMELRDLISRLPEKDRQLMLLRYAEGLTQEAAARQLGLTQVQVSRREAVLRRQLRDAWYGT